MTNRRRSSSRWEDAVPSSVKTARRLLRAHGYEYSVSPQELVAWLKTETPYPNPANEALLENRYLVVHEIVEIVEAKRMGLKITEDVIVKNMEKINDAHLIAAQVEFDVAAKDGAHEYLRSRYKDLKGWCEDPLLNLTQKRRYESFRAATERRLRPKKSG